MVDTTGFQRILAPQDGSALAETAIPYARLLAEPAGEIVLLEVVQAADPAFLEPAQADRDVDLLATLPVDAALAGMEALARRVRSDGLTITPAAVAGDPAEQILVEARARACDAIAIASRGRGGLERWSFGSVADRVVRAAPVPVLVTHPPLEPADSGEPRITRVVVPLDGSDLAEHALPLGAAIARRFAAPLLLVRVLDVDLLRESVRAGNYAATAYARSLDAVRESVRLYLDGEAAKLPAGVAASTLLEEGNPAGRLLALIQPDDLMVMSTRGYGGIKRWLLGSVADKIARHAVAPVLFVREPGEESTV